MRTILTTKHIEVLKFIVAGVDNKMIAKRLNNTQGRISNIRGEIILRMRVTNMYEAVYIATKKGWI